MSLPPPLPHVNAINIELMLIMSYYRSTMRWKPVHPLTAAGVRRIGMRCSCVSEVDLCEVTYTTATQARNLVPFPLIFFFQTAAQLNNIGV